MLKLLTWIMLCCAMPAQAGLFSDDEAHKQIAELGARVVKLETGNAQLKGAVEQQTKSMLDLQSQIEAMNGEIRKLRGQNEEVAHTMQDGEKRLKDFYVDLDARVRHFEAAEEAAKAAMAATPVTPIVAAATDPLDPAPQNRAYESAYALSKAGNHDGAAKAFQEFLKKYSESVHVANAKYGLANAQFALREYRVAEETYQALLATTPNFAKAADVMFNIAGCQQEMHQNTAAKKTLKQLVAKYPNSEAATKANQLLSAAK
ncbi:MAG: tol-pal system protein YbgF [Gallionella sp.]|nr:tol-pal system protein YbgF [Gallionella sp.]